jgi:hypothetical protein
MGCDNDPIVKMFAKTSDLAVRGTRDASLAPVPLLASLGSVSNKRSISHSQSGHSPKAVCRLPTADLSFTMGSFLA